MLEAIGVKRIEDLFADVPPDTLFDPPPELPAPATEMEVVARLQRLAGRNASSASHICLLGGGVYDHYIPAVVPSLISRSEFLTAYAPYQAEMSQGTLQSLFEYQTMICRLFKMDIANSSFYDGASALAAALLMASRKEPERKRVILGHFAPWQIQVVKTHLHGSPLELEFPPQNAAGVLDPEAVSGPGLLAVAVSCPNFVGAIPDMAALSEAAHAAGAFFVSSVDPLSLGVLAPPGSYNSDIAVGEAQGLGIPMNFGGPLLGVMTAKESFLRVLPGRISGQAFDADGRRGYVMTLQTREQHIRRERATSNICSNQALNALAACIYLATVGRKGLTDVAEQCLHKANYLYREILKLEGYAAVFPKASIFKEFAVRMPRPAAETVERALDQGILLGIPIGDVTGNPNDLLMAVTEKRTRAELDTVLHFLRKSR
ncbi:MAG: aminomethyl-transferring glycine dehydrogenase subunit GcvPA [Planctomycetes bacterium]|nr:aminomethyl-transferring glycine dehydrogenase subunit GcvPA [Planctomycetota bacterium]